MEATLAEAEDSLASAERVPLPPASNTRKNTSLAVGGDPCLQRTRYNYRDRPPSASRQMHSEIIIVDDYSLDGTRTLLLELARNLASKSCFKATIEAKVPL